MALSYNALARTPGDPIMRYGTRAGLMPYQSQYGYGTTQADHQVDNEFLPAMQKYPSVYGARAGLLTAPASGSVSAWGSLPAGGAATNSGNGVSGLPLLRTSKSATGNAALESVLGQVGALSNNPNQPLFSSTRDPALQTRINTAGANFDTTTGQANQTLADFTKNFLAGDAEAHANQQQESGAIGRWYGGADDPNSVQAMLDKLVNQRRQAVQGNLMRAMDRATRSGNINRLGVGGDSSYNNQQWMDTVGGLLAQESAQEADLNRANYLTVANAQPALAGKRAGLLNDYLTRSLTPIQAGQQLQGSELAGLGALGNVQHGNRIDQTPEQLLAARLGLIGQYSQDLNGLNIFGVGGNFNSPAANWSLPGRRGLAPMDYGGGNWNDGMTGNNGGATNSRILDPSLRQAYFQTTGVYPESDPHFSQELVNYLRANTQFNYSRNHPDASPEYDDYLRRLAAQGGGDSPDVAYLNEIGGGGEAPTLAGPAAGLMGSPDDYLGTDYLGGNGTPLTPGAAPLARYLPQVGTYRGLVGMK